MEGKLVCLFCLFISVFVLVLTLKWWPLYLINWHFSSKAWTVKFILDHSCSSYIQPCNWRYLANEGNEVLCGGRRAGWTWWWHYLIWISRILTHLLVLRAGFQRCKKVLNSAKLDAIGYLRLAIVCSLAVSADRPLLCRSSCCQSCAGGIYWFPQSWRSACLDRIKAFPFSCWI